MNSKIVKIARTGFVAKASVYAIAGILTLLAAFDLGGEKADQSQVLEFLSEQPFGNALLLLMGLGLACYAVWRFTQAFSDPEGIGSDKKGKFRRTAFFISGCSYLGLGYLAIVELLGSSGNSGDSASDSPFLLTTTGLVLLGVLGLVFAGRGIYQFVRIYRSNFTKKFKLDSLQDEKRRKLIHNTAVMGMISRGSLFLIIGYFTIHAAISANPSEMKNTSEAFSFIESKDYGSWLLGLVAAGLLGYGIYMFMMARYRKFDS